MATVILQALSASIGLTVSGVVTRIRPKEAFACDTAVSAQTDALLAAGYDVAGKSAYVGPALSGANSWIPHNPFGVS